MVTAGRHSPPRQSWSRSSVVIARVSTAHCLKNEVGFSDHCARTSGYYSLLSLKLSQLSCQVYFYTCISLVWKIVCV